MCSTCAVQRKNIIDPDTLHPLDTTALAVPYGSGTSEVPVQKFRDEFKSLNVMHDDSRIYLLLGIENQSEQNFAMPVKNMVYDALEYAGQVENSARSHREAKQWPSTSGEYLTGFYKDDRLIPVITTVVYFGSDTWNAPRSLHEMLSVQGPEILSMVPDYRINLFSPAEIKDEELDNSRAISKKSCSSSNIPKINGSSRSLHHRVPASGHSSSKQPGSSTP